MVQLVRWVHESIKTGVVGLWVAMGQCGRGGGGARVCGALSRGADGNADKAVVGP